MAGAVGCMLVSPSGISTMGALGIALCVVGSNGLGVVGSLVPVGSACMDGGIASPACMISGGALTPPGSPAYVV